MSPSAVRLAPIVLHSSAERSRLAVSTCSLPSVISPALPWLRMCSAVMPVRPLSASASCCTPEEPVSRRISSAPAGTAAASCCQFATFWSTTYTSCGAVAAGCAIGADSVATCSRCGGTGCGGSAWCCASAGALPAWGTSAACVAASTKAAPSNSWRLSNAKRCVRGRRKSTLGSGMRGFQLSKGDGTRGAFVVHDATVVTRRIRDGYGCKRDHTKCNSAGFAVVGAFPTLKAHVMPSRAAAQSGAIVGVANECYRMYVGAEQQCASFAEECRAMPWPSTAAGSMRSAAATATSPPVGSTHVSARSRWRRRTVWVRGTGRPSGGRRCECPLRWRDGSRQWS